MRYTQTKKYLDVLNLNWSTIGAVKNNRHILQRFNHSLHPLEINLFSMANKGR